MANQYKDVQMLNPYKFATYQFMKQYFSVCPRMYMDFGSLDGNFVPQNPWTSVNQQYGHYFSHTSYSYNDILKMIEPFEPQFGLDQWGAPNNEPYDDLYYKRHWSSGVHYYTYVNNWSKCLLPRASVVEQGNNNWGDSGAIPPTEPWYGSGSGDSGSGSGSGGGWIGNTFLYDYADKPSKCFYISGNTESLGYYYDGIDGNHYGYHAGGNQSYHGQIFAAFIPIFTSNRVRRHREFVKIHYSSSRHGLIANENFFSTTTRNGFFTDGGFHFRIIPSSYSSGGGEFYFECDTAGSNLWQASWNNGTYTGHRELTKSNLLMPTTGVTNITGELLPSMKYNLSGRSLSNDVEGCHGWSILHTIYRWLTNDDADQCQYPIGVTLSEQRLILGRINGNV